MVFEYTEDIFDKDKEELLTWLDMNLSFNSKHMTYLMSMLSAIKDLIEEWKRE